jgi:MoaA/NifB/PqqE/SkfB family radical SAM enzyme
MPKLLLPDRGPHEAPWIDAAAVPAMTTRSEGLRLAPGTAEPNGAPDSSLHERARDFVKSVPALRRLALGAIDVRDSARFLVGTTIPELLKARPRKLTIAITAHCNLRCTGCRYGRDFMPGAQLPMNVVGEILDDAAEAGIRTVRLYGGEPLLHPHLPEMITYATGLGLSPYVTTNGILLGQKARQLHEAGLRNVTVGFYGVEDSYDKYVNRPGRFTRLERSIEDTRALLGSRLKMQLNFLLMRPSCSIEAVDAAWRFAERYDMTFHTDLVHYSLPYFTEGEDRELQFRPEDETRIRAVVEHLVSLKQGAPERFPEPIQSLNSIPDWLLQGPEMRVPCDIEKLIWIGADGTVQLCYVTFKLGNVFEKRLRDMLFTDAHNCAARSAYKLECPNCHCERATRIVRHIPSRIKYRG